MKNNLKEYLLEFGFTQKELNNILPKYVNYIFDNILANAKKVNKVFFEFGYKDFEIIKLIKKNPEVYCCTAKNIQDKIDNLLSLGYTKEEIIKMSKMYPGIYRRNIEGINKKVNDLMILGYTKTQILKMTKNMPQIYSYSIKNIIVKIKDLIALGFKKEEVFKLTTELSNIFSYDINAIKQKIANLLIFGYKYEEILEMIKVFPGILSFSIQNINEKINFYKLMGIEKSFIERPKNLIQSIDLSFARFCYFKSEGTIIDMNNYKKLFYDQNVFKSLYNVDNKTLIQKYSYENFISNKKGCK